MKRELMKNSWFAKRAGVLVLAGVLASSALVIAKPFGGHHHSPMAQLEQLDLSDSQSDAIEQIFDQARDQGKSLRKEHRALFKKMDSVAKAALTAADIDSLSQEFGRLSAEKMRQKLSTGAAVAKVLTAQQLAQWDALRDAQRKERREQWKDKKGH